MVDVTTSHDERQNLSEVTLILCESCLGGVGGECHTPGCALWMSQAPDVPIRDRVQSVMRDDLALGALVDAIRWLCTEMPTDWPDVAAGEGRYAVVETVRKATMGEGR